MTLQQHLSPQLISTLLSLLASQEALGLVASAFSDLFRGESALRARVVLVCLCGAQDEPALLSEEERVAALYLLHALRGRDVEATVALLDLAGSAQSAAWERALALQLLSGNLGDTTNRKSRELLERFRQLPPPPVPSREALRRSYLQSHKGESTSALRAAAFFGAVADPEPSVLCGWSPARQAV